MVNEFREATKHEYLLLPALAVHFDCVVKEGLQLDEVANTVIPSGKGRLALEVREPALRHVLGVMFVVAAAPYPYHAIAWYPRAGTVLRSPEISDDDGCDLIRKMPPLVASCRNPRRRFPRSEM